MRWSGLTCTVLLGIFCGIAAAADLSDAQIKELLIRQSIASYPGSCPCPYSLDRAARRCGARSAYSKPGGRSPVCFPDDVTDEMIKRYRAMN